jgi:hypothetical protein
MEIGGLTFVAQFESNIPSSFENFRILSIFLNGLRIPFYATSTSFPHFDVEVSLPPILERFLFLTGDPFEGIISHFTRGSRLPMFRLISFSTRLNNEQ